jgi:hypothetical protein
MRRDSRSFGGWLTGSLLAALLVFTSLGGTLGVRSASAQDITTRAVILHAATDLGKVEVHFNDDEVADELEYGDQTDWVDIDPGTVQVWITRDRAGINYTVFNAVYPVPAGNDYYLIITDALVLGGVFDKSPIQDGSARIGVTHGSVDTPAVNVVATSDQADLATQLGFARTSDEVEVPAGEYTAEIRQADTGDVLATASGTAEAGKVYQHVIIGTPGDEDDPLTVVTLETEATQR